MRPEPLKDKKQVGGEIANLFNNYLTTEKDYWFHIDEVKSAVEWSKQEIRRYFTDGNLKGIQLRYITSVIHEAFQDVIKK